MSKIKVLVPEYVKDFECIGDKCEDTCCKWWDIVVDKKTYKKYQKLKGTDYYPLEDNKVRINKKAKNDNEYANIDMKMKYMDDIGVCPFLQDNLLCGIYINVGEDYLCNTCKSYPRFFNKVDDELEMSLSLSCPEAVRKVLYQENGISFEHIELDFKDHMDNFYATIFTKGKNVKQNRYRYFWDIRIPSITILQNRKLNIITRFVLLGMMYKKVEICINDRNYSQINDEISKFMDMMESSIDNSILEKLTKRRDIQLDIVRTIFSMLEENKVEEYDYCKYRGITYIHDTLSFLNNENLSCEELLQKYNDITDKKVEIFLEKHNIMIENYLVSRYFFELMPFGNLDDIWKSIVFLCSDYFMIKSYLTGLVYKKEKLSQGDLTKDDLFNIIYTLSRVFSHNNNYKNYMTSNIENLGLNSLGGLYILIN